ncbi:MAG: 1-acyl-sn-glycerol-3-phosphate acyltransferase [Desulfohalobiaceae bacterium]|nr:1-acyl-sn-glycerol-3-phosphate acyltransferase [Desulfohalobiaceae bacterium]
MRLYTVVRHLMRIVAHLYFVDIQSTGLEKVPRKGPLIIAANHPGSLLDAILLSTLVQRRISYLAKSELFRYPVVAAIFRGLGVIPVYRAGQPGDSSGNVDTFQCAYQVLENGGCLGIFPEGRNSPRRQIAEIRTGVARIALEAEARNGYRLGLRLVPVGVNFESRELFLTSVFLCFDQPLAITDYAAKHLENPDRAVKDLTGDVQQALRRQALHIEDMRVSQLVGDLSRMVRWDGEMGPATHSGEKAVASGQWRKALQRTWSRLQQWFRPEEAGVRKDLHTVLRGQQHMGDLLAWAAEEEPGVIDDLSAAVERYKSHLAQYRLREDLGDSFDRPVQERLMRLRMTLYAVLMAPFALVGFVHNLPPYLATLFSSRLFREEAIRGFAAFALGIGFFSLAYFFYAAVFWHFLLQSPLLLIAYLVALLWTGFACLRYRRRIMRYRDKILVRTLFSTHRHLSRGLRREREEILSRLRDLQERYHSSAAG